jgi:peptidoglycan hydrolase CwlO-like protein
MSQISELEDYIKRMGEHINLIYKRLEEIEGKINAVSGDVNGLKAATETNKVDISNIRENMVSRPDFDDFVKRLTDSFKELFPPIPKEAPEPP